MDKNGYQATILYVVCHMGLIFFLYPSDMFSGMDMGHWIGISISYALHAAALYMYIKGLKWAAQRNVVDMFRSTGKYLAWILLLPAFFYFGIAIIVTLRAYSEMLTLVFLSSTPLWAVQLLLIAIGLLMAWQGMPSMARTSVLLVVLFMFPILFVLCLGFQNVDWYYLLPLIDREQSLHFIAKPDFLVSLFVYAGGSFFLGLLPPSIHISLKKMMLGCLLLLPMFFLSVYLPLLTFGQSTAELYQFPMLMTIDTVNITWLLFDRITIFFLLSLMAFALLYLGVTLWVLATLAQKAVPNVPSVYLLIALTAGLFAISLAIPNWNSLKNLQVWIIPLRMYIFLVLPLITFLIGWRHKHKANRATEVT
ncbi:spore germination protein [Paenibacillus lautus]|uniref:GerAB/ArcD/ProY family transporter n=1 Tax=Bacillales TaxID=1385 RepID=UPI0011A122FB|nr:MULTISPECIES: GerAB/ArcD/ProY family transporter [Paenibacillus]MCM3257368.1 spore germination protein [Paenibacillus lautus]